MKRIKKYLFGEDFLLTILGILTLLYCRWGITRCSWTFKIETVWTDKCLIALGIMTQIAFSLAWLWILLKIWVPKILHLFSKKSPLPGEGDHG